MGLGWGVLGFGLIMSLYIILAPTSMIGATLFGLTIRLLLFAAGTAASLDLPINQNLGFAYIIPFNKKENGSYKVVAQFQMGYKGFIQLAQRSGQFKTISTSEIYEGQLVEENPLTGFVFDFTKKVSNKVIGYAAYFSLVNGFEKTLYMSVDQVRKHGAKYSKTFKYGLWETDFDVMALKTVLKLLLSKFAPLSIEMERAVLSDQGVVNGWDGQDIEYIDNEPVTLDSKEVSEAKESKRILDHIKKSKNPDELFQVKDHITNEEQKEAYENKFIALTSKN